MTNPNKLYDTQECLGLGLRSSLTWHVKIHDFESIPKTKNKESSMFWDIIGVGICNISTNEAFYAEKSSILRISYTKSEIVSFILNWHNMLFLLTLIMDLFTSNIFIPPSFLPLYISFPPSPSKINGFITVRWPPNQNLRAFSLLQLLKLEKRKCLPIFHWKLYGWDIAILSFLYFPIMLRLG